MRGIFSLLLKLNAHLSALCFRLTTTTDSTNTNAVSIYFKAAQSGMGEGPGLGASIWLHPHINGYMAICVDSSLLHRSIQSIISACLIDGLLVPRTQFTTKWMNRTQINTENTGKIAEQIIMFVANGCHCHRIFYSSFRRLSFLYYANEWRKRMPEEMRWCQIRI